MQDRVSFDIQDERVNIFWQQGFLSLDRITTDDEIEWLRGIYDEIVAQMAGYSPAKIALLAGRQQLPLADGKEILVWIPSPELVFPQLLDTRFYRNAIEIAAHLLDVEPTKIVGRIRVYLKPAHCGAEMPWHQDAAYPGSVDLLKIWMPLDPATPENGCLHFIPGSHLRGIEPHRPYEGSGLIAEGVDTSQAVVCPLPPGGATVHHCHTLHYSRPNHTDSQRRALVISCRVIESESIE
ncbi:phytanoyl-CoA dioxygenase family protein [Chamaesiphon sp.]|uniref:phytanoyl-CoA dioxygenase family protein n=1 Tax=Chamaesiphon sp. TaxID=2814140 RepID=UPI0035940969